MRRPWPFLLVLCATAGCSAPDARVLSAAGDAQDARVERVVDGDTLVVRLAGGDRERVRLLAVDTPESVKPDAPVECFGRAAAAFTRRALDGERVRLVEDVEPRDRFDRLLAYVERARDGLRVNEELVRRGYARVLVLRPNVRRERRLRELERQAQRAGRGLWGACD